MVQVYTQNTNGNVILLCGDRKSFRCRQRAIDSNGLKVKPMKFMSLKQAHKKGNTIYGPVYFYTISKI
uniref:Uncharacterized protein n=1 Tax=viral metagenome TaxID=1070528 RepID=A0A6C0L0J0_9ZZZZ|tara:strand:- start:1898 stop:2101 length:204 start_codon:yes stop_codon:yes gene_type:complete